MKRFGYRWGFALATNNNFRWVNLTIGTSVFLFVVSSLFGISVLFNDGTESLDTQRYRNWMEQGRYRTDFELGVEPSIWAGAWNKTGKKMWQIGFALMFFSFAYFFIAFRDEAGRAIEKTKAKFRKTRATEDLPDDPTPEQVQVAKAEEEAAKEKFSGKSRGFLTIEFVLDFLSELMAEVVARKIPGAK